MGEKLHTIIPPKWCYNNNYTPKEHKKMGIDILVQGMGLVSAITIVVAVGRKLEFWFKVQDKTLVPIFK